MRSILQRFNQVNWKYADEWERDARAAAGNVNEMLHFLHRGTLSKEPQASASSCGEGPGWWAALITNWTGRPLVGRKPIVVTLSK